MWIILKKYIMALVCLSVGMTICFLPPWDSSISHAGMRLLGIFAATIMALIVTDLHISIVSGISLCLLVLSGSLFCTTRDGKGVECWKCGVGDEYKCSMSSDGFAAALRGFSDEINWLVFAAFQMGKAVEITNLGKRISLVMIKRLGKSVLGLGYAIFICECLLALLIPSNTARGGGIMMPIIVSIAKTLNSTPDYEPRRNGGEYLMLCGAHANLVAASLYPTGMAANPLVSMKAKAILGLDFTYFLWFSGAIIPGLFLVVFCPFILLKFSFFRLPGSVKRRTSPVEVTDSEIERFTDEVSTEEEVVPLLKHIRSHVSSELELMGPMSAGEYKLTAILVICCVLWVTQSLSGLDTTLIAFCSVLVMILSGIITWKQVISNEKAWDSFWWLGILIMMANQLELMGVAKAIGLKLSEIVSGIGAIPAALVLGLVYFFGMYLFSSLTGHIVAFSGPFLNAGKALGCPDLLITGIIAYFSTLCGCVTNFSSGPIVIYFSQAYVQRKRWFIVGLLLGIFYVLTYYSVGLLWWKLLGWW